MKLLRVFPIIFSTLLFSAHLLRFYGYWPPVLMMLLCFSLLSDKRRVLQMWQILLAIFTLFWIKITVSLVLLRLEKGMPWQRLALIMSAVVVVNLMSLLWTNRKTVKEMFNR
ncbi:MAG TPA: hypothetical protein ENJ89_01435 [Caldithrix abyssi]|uniref:Uncharacterized protein n=1 Tax=Caldithrix abyssi TaxID=187145 RepID=A0A7V5PNG5_CALAY|nr:hypothetical protein [Caldithrix abyssi]